jgi:hypothetical protein
MKFRVDSKHSKAYFKIQRSSPARLRGWRSEGIVALTEKFRNICFVQGISSDRIQTIIRSRNGNTIDEFSETAIEEESVIFSKDERYRQETTFGRLICSNCGKTWRTAAKFYKKDKKDIRVSKVGSEAQAGTTKFLGSRNVVIGCQNCTQVCHMDRDCKKQTYRKEYPASWKRRWRQTYG